MPTYGYRCQGCGAEFDLWQRMSDEPRADCPACGAPGRRLIYPVGIVFKGSGFYKTDSRSTANGAKPAADTAATPPAGDSAGTAEKPASTATKPAEPSPAPAPAPPSTSTPAPG